jgi:peroxiredoxin
MRQILALFLTISFTFLSCQDNSETYKLEGDAVGYADGTKVLIYSFENRQTRVIDTLIVKDGKFSGTYPNEKGLNLNFIRVGEEKGTIIYFPEDADLKATLYKDSIQASRVHGGKQNKSYTEFADKITEFNNRKQDAMERFQAAQANNDTATITQLQSENLNLMAEETEYKKGFLEKNKNSLFSVMLLSEMVSRQEISPADASEYLNNFDPQVTNSDIAKELKAGLDNMRKADIGVKAPDFSAPTPDGGTMALSDALGKYTIIDFWASWCRPCRVENPNVVKVYKKYHDKGLNIISVSLDREGQHDKWLQAIKDDEMDWYHVSNLQFWNDPIAKEYSVRSIPATFLLDENGVIIDKDLRGAALEAKMASLFEEK